MNVFELSDNNAVCGDFESNFYAPLILKDDINSLRYRNIVVHGVKKIKNAQFTTVELNKDILNLKLDLVFISEVQVFPIENQAYPINKDLKWDLKDVVIYEIEISDKRIIDDKIFGNLKGKIYGKLQKHKKIDKSKVEPSFSNKKKQLENIGANESLSEAIKPIVNIGELVRPKSFLEYIKALFYSSNSTIPAVFGDFESNFYAPLILTDDINSLRYRNIVVHGVKKIKNAQFTTVELNKDILNLKLDLVFISEVQVFPIENQAYPINKDLKWDLKDVVIYEIEISDKRIIDDKIFGNLKGKIYGKLQKHKKIDKSKVEPSFSNKKKQLENIGANESLSEAIKPIVNIGELVRPKSFLEYIKALFYSSNSTIPAVFGDFESNFYAPLILTDDINSLRYRNIVLQGVKKIKNAQFTTGELNKDILNLKLDLVLISEVQVFPIENQVYPLNKDLKWDLKDVVIYEIEISDKRIIDDKIFGNLKGKIYGELVRPKSFLEYLKALIYSSNPTVPSGCLPRFKGGCLGLIMFLMLFALLSLFLNKCLKQDSLQSSDNELHPRQKNEIHDTLYVKSNESKTLVLPNVFFKTHKTEILPSSFAELDNLATFLLENLNTSATIIGHTDNKGIESENLSLSLNRAIAVRNYLLKAGVNKARLKYEGKGSLLPLTDNSTPEGRLINRRVEVKITRN